MAKHDTMQLEIPKGADAALCFIHDQFYLKYINDGAQVGKFLSAASVKAAFSGSAEDSGWLPENVKRCGNGSRGRWMLGYYAPAIYTVKLDLPNLAKKYKAIKVPMPALVWFGIGHNYYIFAMKGNRFDAKGAIYHAPLANVNGHGLICFGKNQHPAVDKGGFEKTWLTFWDAPFNDDHSGGKSKGAPASSINLKLIELHKAKAATYPANDLVAIGSLEKAVQRLTVRDNDRF
jgi:hypothetical protein